MFLWNGGFNRSIHQVMMLDNDENRVSVNDNHWQLILMLQF